MEREGRFFGGGKEKDREKERERDREKDRDRGSEKGSDRGVTSPRKDGSNSNAANSNATSASGGSGSSTGGYSLMSSDDAVEIQNKLARDSNAKERGGGSSFMHMIGIGTKSRSVPAQMSRSDGESNNNSYACQYMEGGANDEMGESDANAGGGGANDNRRFSPTELPLVGLTKSPSTSKSFWDSKFASKSEKNKDNLANAVVLNNSAIISGGMAMSDGEVKKKGSSKSLFARAPNATTMLMTNQATELQMQYVEGGEKEQQQLPQLNLFHLQQSERQEQLLREQQQQFDPRTNPSLSGSMPSTPSSASQQQQLGSSSSQGSTGLLAKRLNYASMSKQHVTHVQELNLASLQAVERDRETQRTEKEKPEKQDGDATTTTTRAGSNVLQSPRLKGERGESSGASQLASPTTSSQGQASQAGSGSGGAGHVRKRSGSLSMLTSFPKAMLSSGSGSGSSGSGSIKDARNAMTNRKPGEPSSPRGEQTTTTINNSTTTDRLSSNTGASNPLVGSSGGDTIGNPGANSSSNYSNSNNNSNASNFSVSPRKSNSKGATSITRPALPSISSSSGQKESATTTTPTPTHRSSDASSSVSVSASSSAPQLLKGVVSGPSNAQVGCDGIGTGNGQSSSTSATLNTSSSTLALPTNRPLVLAKSDPNTSLTSPTSFARATGSAGTAIIAPPTMPVLPQISLASSSSSNARPTLSEDLSQFKLPLPPQSRSRKSDTNRTQQVKPKESANPTNTSNSMSANSSTNDSNSLSSGASLNSSDIPNTTDATTLSAGLSPRATPTTLSGSALNLSAEIEPPPQQSPRKMTITPPSPVKKINRSTSDLRSHVVANNINSNLSNASVSSTKASSDSGGGSESLERTGLPSSTAFASPKKNRSSSDMSGVTQSEMRSLSENLKRQKQKEAARKEGKDGKESKDTKESKEMKESKDGREKDLETCENAMEKSIEIAATAGSSTEPKDSPLTASRAQRSSASKFRRVPDEALPPRKMSGKRSSTADLVGQFTETEMKAMAESLKQQKNSRMNAEGLLAKSAKGLGENGSEKDVL
jgi:hypothetical protein